MQIKMYSIPVMGGELLMEEMNVCLRTKKVLEVEKRFSGPKKAGRWSFCISYLEDMPTVSSDKERPKIDYKQVLDEASYNWFSKMKEIRKQLANDDGIPAYAVFTDEELSNIAKIEDVTLQKIKKIKGIGEKKVEKYAHHFVILSEAKEPI